MMGMSRRPYVYASVHTFYHPEGRSPFNFICSIIGWGKSCIRLWTRSDQNSVSMTIDSSNRVIMGKQCCHFFSFVFHSILFMRTGSDNMHESSDELEIWPDLTTDCGVRCH